MAPTSIGEQLQQVPKAKTGPAKKLVTAQGKQPGRKDRDASRKIIPTGGKN
jgi:hypothetical protein